MSRSFSYIPLILIIGVITASLVIFIQSKLPAQNESQPTTQITPEPTTSSVESQIDTSDWKTYINKRWGYKLKYPKNWYVVEDTERITMLLLQGIKAYPYVEDSSKMISITVFINRRELPRPYFPPGVEIETKKITIGGVEGKEYLLIREKKITTKRILIENTNGRIYAFIVGMENPQTVKIFDQILKTFEFIE
jgi:hypothetical protein